MNINCKTVIPVIGLFFAFLTSISAAPGDMDLSFGSGGTIITTFTSVRDEFSSIIVQPDGRILASGYSWDYDKYDQEEYSIGGFIARYNASGTLDASFGRNGKIFPIVSEPNGNFAYAGLRTVLQPDGRIVTIGKKSFNNPQNFQDFAVFRFNADGTPDASFGTGGIVFTDIQNTYDIVRDVVLQPDGKIVVMGQILNDSRIVLVRYLPNGSLDASFGAGGKVGTPIGSNFHQPKSLLLQPDGKIVIAGIYNNSPFSGDDILLVRYQADGALDPSFGTSGIAVHQAGGHEGALDALLQPDGKIVVTGFGYTGNETGSRTIIVRYNANGTVDTSFAANGIFRTEAGFFTGYGIALQPNGKIISTGFGALAQNAGLTVLRLDAAGSPDQNFGTNGKVVAQIGGEDVFGSAIALQADGKILVSGGTLNVIPGYGDAAIVRFAGDSIVPNRTLWDFDGDRRADISVFRPSDRFWYLNQTTQGFSLTQFGLSTDNLVPSDYDGDGKTDIAVFRDGYWYLLRSTAGFTAVRFGQTGDVPVPADYTGDGRAELAVYRSGAWWTFDLTNNQTQVVNFGLSNDKPVPADFDGDGRADQAIYRSGEWHLNRSNQGYAVVNFGLAADKPVVGDYDGDGRADQAVYRDGIWYLLQSTQGFTAFQFGIASDIPAPADYDGDGKTDAAVFRDGTWYVRQSTNGFTAQPFGSPNDKPVQAAYLP